MPFLQWIDDLIHPWFNSIFTFIQIKFHCNRFQLIVIALYLLSFAFIVGWAIQLMNSVVTMNYWRIPVDMVLAAASVALISIVYMPIIKIAEKYSNDFEDGAKEFPGLQYAVNAARYIRAVLNILVWWVVINDLQLIFVGYSPEGSDHNVLGGVTLYILWIYGHLVETDDIDPKDRDYLFEPEGARDSI